MVTLQHRYVPSWLKCLWSKTSNNLAFLFIKFVSKICYKSSILQELIIEAFYSDFFSRTNNLNILLNTGWAKVNVRLTEVKCHTNFIASHCVNRMWVYWCLAKNIVKLVLANHLLFSECSHFSTNLLEVFILCLEFF